MKGEGWGIDNGGLGLENIEDEVREERGERNEGGKDEGEIMGGIGARERGDKRG